MTGVGYPPNLPTDLTGRMSMFGQLFAKQAGLLDPRAVKSPEDLVALLRIQVPRQSAVAEEAPIYEAAAYVGEWLRHHAPEASTEWVAEAGTEPNLQLHDGSGAITLLVPLVSILRTAMTAGYDGVPALLRETRGAVRHPATVTPIETLPVKPETDRPRVVEWLRANAGVRDGTRVALWRRCGACGTPNEESLVMPPSSLDWESEAGLAAGLLAERPFVCSCGGQAGDTSRLLMIRREGSEVRFGDIRVTPSGTRLSCWTLDGDLAVPFDARVLTHEPQTVELDKQGY